MFQGSRSDAGVAAINDHAEILGDDCWSCAVFKLEE